MSALGKLSQRIFAPVAVGAMAFGGGLGPLTGTAQAEEPKAPMIFANAATAAKPAPYKESATHKAIVWAKANPEGIAIIVADGTEDTNPPEALGSLFVSAFAKLHGVEAKFFVRPSGSKYNFATFLNAYNPLGNGLTGTDGKPTGIYNGGMLQSKSDFVDVTNEIVEWHEVSTQRHAASSNGVKPAPDLANN